ncbi:MAG: class E sortase [Actinomycetota bacterium]
MGLKTWAKTHTGRRALAMGLATLAGLMVLGAGWLGAYPFYTDLRANKDQERLTVAFATVKTKDAFQNRELVEGSPLTRMVIPKIGVDTMVVQGLSLKALNTGAGHYQMTPLPGEPGNVGIAGHRTMYGKPFQDIDKLVEGDKIELITPFAKHTYEMIGPFDGHANPWVVAQNNWNVIDPTLEPMLTMTACHPKGSSKQRIVARARLINSEPIK